MRRLLFTLLILLFATLLLVQCAPIEEGRPRRDLKALERIMREMVESHAIINNPAFRPGR
ncbi:hypothetical protein ANCCAN_16892 [Ancylostoma caninum]|uniref:Uncharacterized protein n=1 Tax=Ancylostoma caninum TaxID=29170 RepID=A0A368FYF9_ANCCA|nr:hypothetical protein ANCCAN_16892 [Ancylostoma caninum]